MAQHFYTAVTQGRPDKGMSRAGARPSKPGVSTRCGPSSSRCSWRR